MWQSLLSHVEATVGVTGDWDDDTGRATAEWQQSVGIVPADGTLDGTSWATAEDALAYLAAQRPDQRPDLAAGDTGEHVRYAQRRLVAAGRTVTINGVFSPSMARQVRSFRENRGLPSGTGIDGDVWEALG